jgi:hypothetical protein
LSSKNKNESFYTFGKQDLQDYKQSSFEDKQWWIDLQPDEKWTWVFAT